jgi:hypothetical protein
MNGKMHIAHASELCGRAAPAVLRASSGYSYYYYLCPRAGPF